ncbi:hypothetical protein GOBAR_DD31904 [Gossypium barbadense]|nr:hypothetical protein GOBAR_DD31904 [Gossypium barbadense]
MIHDYGPPKIIIVQFLAASIIGAAAIAAASDFRPKRNPVKDRHRSLLIPLQQRTARQLGFEDANECPKLCKLAENYLKKPKDCEVLGVESEKKTKLKDFVMAATRQTRFERVIKDLKVARVFSTLVEEMKAMGRVDGEAKCTDVMVPVAHSRRSPVLLLMGGGMGAGKSTVLKDIILKESFWAEAAANAVVVEADAFKETDVIFRALSSRGHHHDILPTSELSYNVPMKLMDFSIVHQSSTDAASSLLVTALNEGRDVIMDGTLSWEPFVEQTIAMARNVHKHRYRMGVGYKVDKDGKITENYWEQIEEEEENDDHQTHRKPYRIELVGVVCDAYLAVVRGIRRAIMVKRAVRINSQLKSHKSFASAFPRYCQFVDNARLYCTNAVKGPPKLIAWKDGENKLLIDPDDIKWLSNVSKLNPGADCVNELYNQDPSPVDEPGSVWKDIVLDPSRPTIQFELKASIQRIETTTLTTTSIADVETEVAAAGVPKKRTFKKFSFRGVDLDALLDMSTDELVKLFPARARRR